MTSEEKFIKLHGDTPRGHFSICTSWIIWHLWHKIEETSPLAESPEESAYKYNSTNRLLG